MQGVFIGRQFHFLFQLENGHIVLFRPGCKTYIKRTNNFKSIQSHFYRHALIYLSHYCPLACVDKLNPFLIKLQLTPSIPVV